MRTRPTLIFILFLLGLHSCKKDSIQPTTGNPNILLIIADDLGKDALNGFSEGNIKPYTPNIDAIRSSGISFENFWSYPTCTPTRSSIITGKYGYRTGVKWAGDVLPESQLTLQQYISNGTGNEYASAVIGKWHLSGNNATTNPEDYGIDHYAGLIRGAADDYYNWQLSEDGSMSNQTEYISAYFTDRAISWISEQNKPWFLWLAYTAPHSPFHVPPSDMHSQGALPEYQQGMNATPYYMAAIEAMDYQIGRLIDTISESQLENTVIIFIGDNGTPGQVIQTPYTQGRAKGSLFQGGINVPLFVSGCGVTRTGTDQSLICGTDLFATVAEIAGVQVQEIYDSKSFKTLLSENESPRAYQYSEMDDGNTDAWTISNGNYKLMVESDGTERLFDLRDDPYETTPLVLSQLTQEAEIAKLELETELNIIRN